ncbi:MAG: Ig-like domain-containing protein [Acidobacteriota bacterium]
MSLYLRRSCFLALAIAFLWPSLALAAGVKVLFDLSSPLTGPFPSNRFTVSDQTHITQLRVNLPKPDCTARPSDCADIDVINTLDGFNLQPRLSVPFNGAIDLSTVTSANIFLISLGDADNPSSGAGKIIGINQIVWDQATNTLHVESNEFLDQHTTYGLIVTNSVRDATGDPVETGDFRRFLKSKKIKDKDLKQYRKDLRRALKASGLSSRNVVAISVFTTQSATALLEKIRDQIKKSTPAAANFLIGSGGERTIFPLSSISSIMLSRQVGTAPTFTSTQVPVAALGLLQGAVGTVAFGRYSSPNYETAERFIPAVGTRTGMPAVQNSNDIFFNLFLPSGPKPSGGWPVAIFGHGFGDSKQGGPIVVAASMAAQGIATIAINVVGHGGGELGTLAVNRSGMPTVMLPAGGRGIDQNGDKMIDSTEGVSAAPTRGIISNRDGLRQTVVDIMQLVRVIEVNGMDVDGDGAADLSNSRIYYFGQSFGGIYGSMLLGVEPSIKAGVLNVAGGAIVELARLGGFRPLTAATLAARTPSLLNALPVTAPLFGFNENLPLRNKPPVVNTVAGAIAIQQVFENTEWVAQAGDPVAYAPHIRKAPLNGNTPVPVIVQFAKGDQTVPNPTNTNIIRAGGLADRATYFRNDLVVSAFPDAPKNPHTFLTAIANQAVGNLAFAAQAQIAMFFATNGMMIIDPDSSGTFFETPIVSPLPEELNFIQ